jgi:hypothetical protein
MTMRSSGNTPRRGLIHIAVLLTSLLISKDVFADSLLRACG